MHLNIVCRKSYNLGVCGGMIFKENFRSHYVTVIDHSQGLYICNTISITPEGIA